MNLEELNKSQIVLLTLLTSFVTSIATGIVTVALIEEAPSDVTRVVQRVIEHTTETIKPSEQQATVITQEKTIIVKEADLIAGAVAKNGAYVVSIKNADGAFVSLGTIVDAQGHIIADAKNVVPEGSYTIQVGSTASVALVLVHISEADGIAVFTLKDASVGSGGATVVTKKPSLGQTVFTFVGEQAGGIAQGIVARVNDTITTDIVFESPTAGAPLFSVEGELLGVSTSVSRVVGGSSFIPASAIISSLPDSAPTTETPTP